MSSPTLTVVFDAALDEPDRVRALTAPLEGPVVLDTDAYNEVDDQFAIADLVRSDREVAALHAAPFDNRRADDPATGMERSHAEIGRVLDRLGVDRPTLRGGSRYLEGPDDAVDSPAVGSLIDRAHARDGFLPVVAIGAATNVASAIVRDPSILREVVVVWLGGTRYGWHTASEFNLSGDPVAARILYDSGVPLINVPTVDVAEHLTTSVPELRELFGIDGERRAEAADASDSTDEGGATESIGDFLVGRVADYEYADERAWSKTIWDLAATAVFTEPDAVESALVPSPVLTSDETWSRDPRRHAVRVLRRVDRDAILRGLAERLDDG